MQKFKRKQDWNCIWCAPHKCIVYINIMHSTVYIKVLTDKHCLIWMRQVQIKNPSMLSVLYDLFSIVLQESSCYMLRGMSLHRQLVNAMNELLCQVKKDLALFQDWDLRLKSSSVELMSDAKLSSEFTKCTAFMCNMLQVATVVNIHTGWFRRNMHYFGIW